MHDAKKRIAVQDERIKVLENDLQEERRKVSSYVARVLITNLHGSQFVVVCCKCVLLRFHSYQRQ